MEMKVYLKEAGDSTAQWIDITERTARPSVKLTEGFSTEGETEDASELTLTIRALNLTDAASFHTSEKLVRLVIDGTVAFEGYSDGKATVDMGISSSFVHVKVSFSSYMALLEDAKAPAGGVVYEGKKIFDPADKQNSLVHLLADAMYQNIPEEYQAELSSQTERVTAAANVQACQKTLPIVYVPEDECIFDTFQTILYENGYSFYFRSKQIEILAPWDTERTASQCVLQDFISKPTLKQQPLRHRTHLALSIASYTSQDTATLYDSGDPNSDEGKPEVIEPKKAYPEDREPQGLDYSNPDDEEAEIVYSVDPELSYTCVQVDDSAEDYDDWGTDPAPVKVTEDIRPEEGSVLFENENDYRIGIQRYRVTADKAWWKKYSITVKDSIKEGDEEEYEADYIPDTEAGEAFVAMYHLQEYANNAEITLSTELMNLVPGQLVQVTELPYKLLVLSRQTTYDNPGKPLYKYSMIPIVYIETPTDVTHTSSGGSSALRYIFLELSSVYFHYDSEGSLAPADQVIYAQVTRVNVQSTPIWMINGQVATPVEGNPDRLMISPSHMEGRQVITVSVQCGRFSKALTIAKVQDGSGGNPIQFFQWGESNTKQPDDVSEILVWGDLAITINGWALVTNPGEWEKEVPTDHPEDKPYLWCRFWNYQTEDWSYYVMNGSPAVGFTLDITPQTYRLTSRGYTKAGQTVRAICRKQNTNGVAVWSVSDSRVTLQETPDGLGPDDITLTIPEMVQMQSFELTCSIAVIGLTKTHTIGGIQEGNKTMEYLHIYPSVDSLPEMMEEGAVEYGDHAMVEDAQGNRLPYYYTGSQWVMADGNTPASVAWVLLQNVLWDATSAPNTQQVLSAINIFAQNFATVNGFAESFCANALKIMNVLFGGDYNADGTRVTGIKPGFHFDALSGILRAYGAILESVKIIAKDGQERTVLETFAPDVAEGFEYSFNVTPNAFRKSQLGSNTMMINGEEVSLVPVISVTDDSGQTYKGLSRGREEYEGHVYSHVSSYFAASQDCSVIPHLAYEGVELQSFNVRIVLGSANIYSETIPNASGDKDYIFGNPIELEAGEHLWVYYDGMDDFDCDSLVAEMIQLIDGIPNAFSSVSNPDTAYVKTDGNEIVAFSVGEYVNVGTAAVAQSASVPLPLMYKDTETGILEDLAAEFESGKTYIVDSGTISYGSTLRSVDSITSYGTSFILSMSDGSSFSIADDHMAINISLEGSAQPSYVNIFRLLCLDSGGGIGTNTQRIPEIFADRITGTLQRACFAGYGQSSNASRPAIIIAAIGSETSSIDPISEKDGNENFLNSNSWELGSWSVSLRSDGLMEIAFEMASVDDRTTGILDDTYGYLVFGDIELDSVLSVQCSGFRDTYTQYSSDTKWPDLSGTDNTTMCDAYYSISNRRIYIMNDYLATDRIWVSVRGYVSQTQYNQVMNSGGNLSVLF